MGKLLYLMGKSASGKDTQYKRLMEAFPALSSVVMYTTRPMREGEENGREYHFVTEAQLQEFLEAGKVIELREYQTAHGPWKYFTPEDGQIDVQSNSYLLMGTLESYEKMRAYYGRETIVPIYLEVEDGLRLERAVQREKTQDQPKYEELCRRFLADAKDFSVERLEEAGITRIFQNQDAETCFSEIGIYIQENL